MTIAVEELPRTTGDRGSVPVMNEQEADAAIAGAMSSVNPDWAQHPSGGDTGWTRYRRLSTDEGRYDVILMQAGPLFGSYAAAIRNALGDRAGKITGT